MAVYVTGDVHANPQDIKIIPERCPLGEGDIVIIAGDFGLPWSVWNIKRWREERALLDWLEQQPYTTVFVDGNHENFDLLYDRPTEERWGGRVHRINDKVFHLCRGQIFDFESNGKKTFVFGGATSVDKAHRVEGESWWPQENASPEEMQEGLATLEKHNWQVDYVVTHTAPKQFLGAFYKHMSFKQEIPCPTQEYLTTLADKLDWDMWYFGHFHDDEKQAQVKARLLYNDIVLLGD